MRSLGRDLILICSVILAVPACNATEHDDEAHDEGDDETHDDDDGEDSHSEEVPPEFAGKMNPMTTADGAAVQAGAALYAAQCENCHGDAGLGDGPGAADLAKPPSSLVDAHANEWSDDVILWRVSVGDPAEGMPAFAGVFDENELWQVITFIRSLQGA